MQTRIINSGIDSGVSLVNDKDKNEDNKHHHIVLDTTLDVSSSSSDDHSNVDGRNNSGRLSAEDMNDNSKQMSTSSSSDEEKLTPSSPSYDSTEANNCNIMSSSIAKHNKMIDDQSTTTADDDDKNTNEKGCEVVISDNTSTNKAANVLSSTTTCKSSNDDNNQPSHNLENDTSTTANHNNKNNTTTKVIVNDKKEASQRANTTNNQKGGGGGPYSSSSSHIYALREIICSSSSEIHNNVSPTASCEEVQYDLLDNEEEEEKKECSRPIYNDINSTKQQKSNKVEEEDHPRIITSQIVQTNQDMYKSLECNTAGKVLCPCKQQQTQHVNNNSSSSTGDEANELKDINGINFTACTVSSIIDQMKNTDVDIDCSSSDCTTLMMKNCPISSTEKHQDKDTTTTALPTKKKKYLPIRIYKSIKGICQRSPIKQHRAKKKQRRQQKPKMVIKNGIIDWTRSENLENCNNIDEHMLTVEYMTGSAHRDEEKGMKKQQKKKKKKKKKKGKNRQGKKKGDRGGITLTTSVCSSRDGTTMPEEMKSLGSTIFSDESVINNTIEPSEYFAVVSSEVILECFEMFHVLNNTFILFYTKLTR